MRNIIGKSAQGRDLILHSNFPLDRAAAMPAQNASESTLLIGGTHGDERATVAILENFRAGWLDAGRIRQPVAVLSLHNPDGHAADTRYNGRGVDLNRNFARHWIPDADEPSGPAPLSEPENLALQAFILEQRPARIVSLHWALSEIDADGPQSTEMALRMWHALSDSERKPYRLRVHGAETPALPACPGSLGQWVGHGLVYPDGSRPAMVTLELPYHAHAYTRPERLPDDHLETVRELWLSRPQDYLLGVQDQVHRMLAAAIGESPRPTPATDSGLPE